MDLIWLLFTLIYATIVIYMLIDCEVKHKKNLYWLGLFVTVMILIDSFVWINFGHETFMKRYTLLAQIPLFIAFVFVSKYKGIKLLFVHLTVIALVSSLVLIAVLIASYFGLSKTYMNLICLILYIPAGFITYRYLRPYILYMLRNTDKGWLGFCVIPLTYSIITYSFGHYNTGDMISQTSLAPIIRGLIFTLVSYIMILWLFKQTREQLALQNEQNLLQMQITASKQNLEALKESQEKTIIYRHDMRHHLNLINAYLADNNKEAAQNYIAEVERNIERVTVETYCSNYSLNLIVSFYITKAKEQNIDVEAQIDLPRELAVSDMDLCLVFSNAIENAINALDSIQSTDGKFLKILCKTQNNKLLIAITNRFEGTVIFVDEIPINKSENHGLGTKSIAAIAEKYNGVYSFTAENGIFNTRIIL
jgi:CRISPR/Cas system CMR subunit Cmr6 (Cas7 group RAMP superfamily)